MKLNHLKYLIIIVVISILMASSNKETYETIESILPTVLSAVLGGLLAAISIVIAVFSTASVKVKKSAISNLASFNKFTTSLRKDMLIIVSCLFLSIVLPYFRHFEFKFEIIVKDENILDKVPYLISSAEIFILIISFCIIFEIIEVLIDVIKSTFDIGKD